MIQRSAGRMIHRIGLSALVLCLAGIPTLSTVVKTPKHTLDSMSYSHPSLRVSDTPESSESIRTLLPNAKSLDAFIGDHGTAWHFVVDQRRGRVDLMDGGAIPFIPGVGNSLRWEEFGAPCGENECIPVSVVEKVARDFLAKYRDVFQVDPSQLVLDPNGSGPTGNSLYFLRFQWAPAGIPVDGGSVFFRINSGNLIQVGTSMIGDFDLATTPSISLETAWEVLRGYLGEIAPDAEDTVDDPGTLIILPATPKGDDPEHFNGRFGKMISYHLVYRMSFRRPEVTGAWEGLVDAHTGELLSFVDTMRYGRIHGGIRASDGLPAEEDHPFPFANIGGGLYTDSAGNFTGNNATTSLTGKYAHIIDSCGSISGTTTTGEINFLTGPSGTDCSVPTGNTCGAGNTKPSRTLFWNCTNINLRAQVWNPTNTWLTSNYVNLNVNGSASCNAGSSGLNIYFYKKASGCNNLGEIPGVAMHEWAHSYDSSDGSGQQDKPLETYADWTAIMSTHLSCTGAGFLTSGKCSGYGDTCKTCSGVRDCDYAAHQANTPWTSANKGSVWGTGGNCCTSSTCPGYYYGPCGWEDHCESGFATQALWDFVARDLVGAPTNMDINSAWALEDRLWFTGVKTLDNFYTCSGGVTSGCTGNTLYNIMRAVDDDGDGTANGTPHAAAIFAALNRHGIACGAVGDATNQNQTSCPTLTITTLSGVAGSGQCVLNWSVVTNATRYFIYRNEGTCSAGFTKIATVNAPAVTYTDTNVSNGITYNYRFMAATASDSCNSAISNCLTLTPAAGGCTAPGAPNLTAATGNCGGVNLTWTAGTGTTSSYNVYRVAGACGGAYAKLAGPVTATTYSDTTAVAGTTYAYVVRGACDAAGATESANSNCRTAAILTTPSIPAAPTVTDDCTGLIVTWTAIAGASSYDVMRRANGCGNNSWSAAQSGATGTTWTDTTAAVGTTYGYYIVANNACGTAGDKANCTALAHTTAGAPAAPTGLATTGACTGVNLSWTASTGATSYNVLRTTNSNCSTGLAQIGTSTTTTYLDTTAVAGTTYYYVVQAVSACGTSGSSTCANAARLATPAAPTGLSASGDCSGVNLSWTAASGATSYNVLRTTNSNCTTGLAQIGTSATTTYADTTAVAGTTYYYVVQSVNSCGTSANSTCANAARTAAPSVPTGLSASGDCSGVNLSWAAASGATSYNVVRTTNSNCSTGLAQIGTSATTTYADTTAVAGTTYYYVVQAVNTCGTSAGSTCANSARLAAPAAPGAPTYTSVSCTTLTVNWSAVSGTTAYDLYRRTGACGTGSTIATNLTGTTYGDTGLTASTQYSYYLVAKNTCGSSAAGTCTSATTTGGPTAPAAPTVTDACTGLAISWTAVSGATSYNVYRRASGCGTNSWSSVQTGVTGTTWTDTGTTIGTTYGYYIEAVNACGTATSGNGACAAGTHSLQTPSAPGSVTATGTCADVTVTWGTVSGATSYNVLRGSACGTVATTFTGVTSPYHDSAAVAGTTYQYWIVAVNTCGNSANSSCASAARLVNPNPTITGANSNTCPAATVLLTTESGQSSYQWYRGGSPISGANAFQYAVTQTGDYTVSYLASNGCSGTSALKTVAITACVPNIVYSANGSWTQVYGNSDSVVDPGETWDVTVTLQNLGTGNATSVSAGLTATGATFCTGTASYGAIAAGGTATGTFRFVVGSSFTCGNNLSFNVVSKSSTEGSYTDENGAFTRQVGTLGSGTPEVASTVDFTATKNTTQTKALAPNPTIAAASCQGAVATFTANTQFAKVTSALLRHVGSGATVALNLPTGNGVAVATTVTSFYQAHGAGTYQMEWTIGNQPVDLASINLTVTPASTPICNIWAGQSCLAGPTPKPVPDGKWVAGTPLTASKVDGIATQITLGWGVACPSTGYNVLYGNGSQVSSVTTSGSQCGIGTTGSYPWITAPAIPSGETFVWWVIVGTDGAATEGSWGKNSAGNERNGSAASGRCGFNAKSTAGTCP